MGGGNEMNQEQIKQLQDAIRKAYSNWDYYKFCEVMGFNPKYDGKYWDMFQTLVSGLTAFDEGTLTRLILAAMPAPNGVHLTIIGHSTDQQYPVVELIAALEDAIDDLTQMTTPTEGDQPQPFSQTYPTDCGELLVKLEISSTFEAVTA